MINLFDLILAITNILFIINTILTIIISRKIKKILKSLELVRRGN